MAGSGGMDLHLCPVFCSVAFRSSIGRNVAAPEPPVPSAGLPLARPGPGSSAHLPWRSRQCPRVWGPGGALGSGCFAHRLSGNLPRVSGDPQAFRLPFLASLCPSRQFPGCGWQLSAAVIFLIIPFVLVGFSFIKFLVVLIGLGEEVLR